MSKRSQTTGVPKPGQIKRITPETPTKRRLQPRLLREYQTKHEREAAIQRLIILVTAAVGALALVILLIAVAIDQLVVPGRAVASVNGETVTVGEFRDRARLERALLNDQLNSAIAAISQIYGQDQVTNIITGQEPYATWWNEMNVPDQLGNRVLNEMIDDELVRQEASARGISVTDEQVDQKINDFFGYDPNAALGDATPSPTPTTSPTPFVSPTPSPAPTQTPTPAQSPTPSPSPFPSATPSGTPDAAQRAETFNTQRNDYFGQVRRLTGLSDDYIRGYFAQLALRENLAADLAGDTNTGLYVNARHILVDSVEQAEDVLQALENGESFAALAQNLSTDTGSGARGGELDWAAVSRYVEPFADAVRDAEIGAYVGPVQSEFGYHIIQVRAREERELEGTELETERESQLAQHIEALRESESTNVEISDIWTDYVPNTPQFTLISF